MSDKKRKEMHDFDRRTLGNTSYDNMTNDYDTRLKVIQEKYEKNLNVVLARMESVRQELEDCKKKNDELTVDLADEKRDHNITINTLSHVQSERDRALEQIEIYKKQIQTVNIDKILPSFSKALEAFHCKSPAQQINQKHLCYEECTNILKSLLEDTSKLVSRTVNLSVEDNEVAKNYTCPLKGGVPDECVCGPDGTNYDYDSFRNYVKFKRWNIRYGKDFLMVSSFTSPTSRITYPSGAITMGHQANNVLEHIRRQKTMKILQEFERDTLKMVLPGRRKLEELWHYLI